MLRYQMTYAWKKKELVDELLGKNKCPNYLLIRKVSSWGQSILVKSSMIYVTRLLWLSRDDFETKLKYIVE